MDAALALCKETGFQSLAIEQVTAAVGVAKGTFYYHFPTKDALLTALVQRFSDGLLNHLEAELAEHEDAPGIERLRMLLAAASSYKSDELEASMAVVPFLYRADNRVLRDGFYDAWFARTRQFLTPILAAGHADGTLVAEDPTSTAHMLLTLWIDGGARFLDHALTLPDADAFADSLLRDTRRMWQAQEQILQLEPGTLAFPEVDPAMVAAFHAPFLAAINGH